MSDERIAVENKTAMPMYVAGSMIPPGETRHFPCYQVPEHLRPAPSATAEPEAEEVDSLADLVGHSVKDIVEALPQLSDAQLLRVLELDEADGSPRKTLHEAVAAERLRRAADLGQGGPGAEKLDDPLE